MSRFKLTYANVMVTVLAFIVLAGGTAFAANQLGKNSVGTKQLKKNAVNGAKVKDQSLTGKDINLAKLGTVPSASSAANAANATMAGTASALTPPEAVHVIGAPGQPAFQSGSSNYPPVFGVPFPPVAFYKDHEGIVHLEGLVKVGKEGAMPGLIFTLPPGFRPASDTLRVFEPIQKGTVLIAGSNTNTAGLTLDGDLLGAGEETASLEGITFRAQS